MTLATLEQPVSGIEPEQQDSVDVSACPSKPPASAATILAVAAWIGLLVGGMEGLRWAVGQWTTGELVFMYPGYLWAAPITQLILCVAVGTGPALYRTLRPTPGVDGFSLAAVLFVGWLNVIQLWVPGMSLLAWLLLSGGLATVTKRGLERHAERFHGVVWRSLPGLLAFVVLAAGFQNGLAVRQEKTALAALPAAPADAPNVLLIVLDTVRADAVLSDSGITPQIARFAERGVQFAAAKSTAPWTLPSQAGMFTGRLPHELSSDWWSRLDETHPTLAEVLGKHGWNTGGFVGNTRYCSAETGLSRGFVHYEDYQASCAGMLLTSALGRRVLLSPLPTFFGMCDWPGRKHASEINASFLDWIDRHSGRPFFAFLNYWDAHDPYFAPEGFQTQVQPQGDDLMLLRDWWWTHKDDLSPSQVAMLQTAYEDCIRGLDDQVGKLLGELERRKRLANTLVIITADHGEHFGDHELYLHGNSLYEACLRVPLKVVMPGKVPSGVRVQEPVSLQALPNTVLSLLGLELDFPGTPWSRVWNASGEDTRRPVISEIANQAGFPPCHGRSPVAAGPMQSVQWGNWKMIRDALGAEQLFDVAEDPGETRNLVLDSEHLETADQMRGLLRAANPGGALSPWPTVPKLDGP